MLIAVLVVFVAGAAVAGYAFLVPRKVPVPVETSSTPEALPAKSDWASEVGDEFATLSESARCDFVFAIATLDDDNSHRLLVHALGDPSDAVALAAAHALARSGRIDEVRTFANERAGPRAAALLRTLALLD